MIRPSEEPLAPELKLSHTDIHATRARRREQRALWRLSAWGGAAALGLAAVVLVSQTEIGGQRLQLAFSGTKEPNTAALLASANERADEAEAETRRLAVKVRDLSGDRDRLNARLASLERSLDDVTGSITRQRAVAGRPPAPAAAAPPAPVIEPLAMLEPKPATWPAATQPQAKPPPPSSVASAPPAAAPAAPAVAALAPKVPLTAVATPPAAATPPPTATAPPLKSQVVVDVPMPPVRVATVPIRPQNAPLPTKVEFGIDVGGALLTNFLAAQWAEMKANFGPLLAGLYPVIARDGRFGHSPYRLLIGPLPNSADAARLCLRLGLKHSRCRPARFAGERLAQY
jgi:hypothetical protein